VAQTANAKVSKPSERKLFIQVVGHTSATGDIEHNQELGLQRAMVTTDFIRGGIKHWFNLFLNGVWTQDEIDFMSYYVLFKSIFMPKDIDWQAIGQRNTKASLVSQLKEQLPNIDQRYAPILNKEHIRERFFFTEEAWYTPLPAQYDSIHPTRLHELIDQYQQHLGRPTYPNIRFHSSPFASMGETDLKIPVSQEIAGNRRCELVAWEMESHVKEGKVDLYLGNIYAKFHGHISAWAGVNMALGGEIAVACPDGVLSVVGAIADKTKDGVVSQKTIKKASGALSAGANAAAFAGAKAEIGLKASIDWRKPDPHQCTPQSHPQANKAPAKPSTPSAFKPFGSVGYTATAMAGIGFTGEFKIGFDDESQRFVVKVRYWWPARYCHWRGRDMGVCHLCPRRARAQPF